MQQLCQGPEKDPNCNPQIKGNWFGWTETTQELLRLLEYCLESSEIYIAEVVIRKEAPV